jgi:O-antigen ligase
VLGLLVVAGIAGIYLAARAGGPGAGILAALAATSALALAVRAEISPVETVSLQDVFDGLLTLLPGVLVIYFAFDTGGYFPESPAFVAIVLVIILVLRVTLVDQPFEGFSRPLAVAVAALGLLACWMLLSGVWSDAPSRALVEFDRAYMYLLVFVLAGVTARTAMRLRWLAASIGAGCVVVSASALATRLVPDRFPTDIPAIGENNLAYPLTYSNALGMLSVTGAILAMYFASSTRLPRAARVVGTAALPIFAVTVYLTLSRGPVAAFAIGIVAFALLGRPRGLLPALVAAGPTSAIAIASAYQHPLLTGADPAGAAGTAQGHKVALVVALCVIAAAAGRLLLTPLDMRLAGFSLPERSRRPVLAASWIGLVVGIVIVALAVRAPSRISDQYHRFIDAAEASPTQDIRKSIFSSANRGLLANWSVGLDAFKDRPLLGQGAGTYEVYWNEHRPAKQVAYNVTDGHSLYIEALGELGLVGFVLVLIVIVTVLVALLPWRRGRNRTLYAALFAAALAWVFHAGVDWDWEMPAVTLPFFAFGGAALALHRRATLPSWPSQAVRVTAGLLLLCTAAAPGLIFTSQRQLNDARDALRAGNCGTAIARATASISTLSIRPEPYEIVALCQATAKRTGFAIQSMTKAEHYDPGNWRYAFELGVLQGGAGLNPHPELAKAHRLNPALQEVTDLLASVPKGTAVDWDLEMMAPSGAIAKPR